MRRGSGTTLGTWTATAGILITGTRDAREAGRRVMHRPLGASTQGTLRRGWRACRYRDTVCAITVGRSAEPLDKATEAVLGAAERDAWLKVRASPLAQDPLPTHNAGRSALRTSA